MKKIITLGITGIMLLTLSGCGSTNTKVSDSDMVLISIGNEKYTKEDLYSEIKEKMSTNVIPSIIDTKLFELEVPTTPELEAKAKESLEAMKTSLGENFPMYLAQMGYTDETKFYNERILSSTKMAGLATKYVNDNYDKMVKEYNPVKVQIMQVTNKEEGTKAIELIKGGKTLEEAYVELAKTPSPTAVYKGKEQIVTTGTDVPTVITEQLKTLEKDQVSGVIEDSANQAFYVVKVLDKDANNYKEGAASSMASSTAVSKKAFSHYLEVHDFAFHDQGIRDSFAKSLPEYLGE
ncbi:MAG: hypothetical protein RR929_04235 [Erysipelotrichaceae bacterium]